MIFAPSIWTLEIDGKPTLAFEAMKYREADEICHEDHSGRWESRLKAMVHPRPWLERWRALSQETDLPRCGVHFDSGATSRR